jgi:hypothetical protein
MEAPILFSVNKPLSCNFLGIQPPVISLAHERTHSFQDWRLDSREAQCIALSSNARKGS